MMKTIINLTTVMILFACASVSVIPQQKVTALKEVKVYFYHDPGEYIDLAPVMRSVNAAAPARPAIEALLKGPTAAEKRRVLRGNSADDCWSVSCVVHNPKRQSARAPY